MKRLLLMILLAYAGSGFAQDIPRTLYVENSTARTLSAIPLDDQVVQNDVTELGLYPNKVMTYHDRIYVLCSGTAEIMEIDPADHSVRRRIALPEGSNPYDMAVVGANRLYVSLLLSNTIAVVDLESGTVTKEIEVGIGPEGLLVDNTTAFVTNTALQGWSQYGQGTVSIIDIKTDSVTHTVPVPTNPQAIVKAPDFNYYVVCTGDYMSESGKLVALSLYDATWAYNPSAVDTFVVGGAPGDLVSLPNGDIYMTDWGDEQNGFVYRFNVFSQTVAADRNQPIRVAKGASRLLYDPDAGDLYVSAFSQGAVHRLDPNTATIQETFPCNDGAHSMALLEAIPETDPWADAVVAFDAGDPWSGAGSTFFPDNVLGPPAPDPAISSTNPAYRAQDVLSLGYGGSITLAFTNNVVMNGDGADFIVFENVFIPFGSTLPVREPATVSVSQDGETWHTFPYDTTTFEGLAGVTPVKSTLNPTHPDSSGADAFDLNAVGLDWIRFIRLDDLGSRWRAGDTFIDFDLDAVVAVHSEKSVPTEVADRSELMPDRFQLSAAYPNPFNPSTALRLTLERDARVHIAVFDITGARVRTLVEGTLAAGHHQVRWDGRDDRQRRLASGVYLIRMHTGTKQYVRRVTLVK